MCSNQLMIAIQPKVFLNDLLKVSLLFQTKIFSTNKMFSTKIVVFYFTVFVVNISSVLIFNGKSLIKISPFLLIGKRVLRSSSKYIWWAQWNRTTCNRCNRCRAESTRCHISLTTINVEWNNKCWKSQWIQSSFEHHEFTFVSLRNGTKSKPRSKSFRFHIQFAAINVEWNNSKFGRINWKYWKSKWLKSIFKCHEFTFDGFGNGTKSKSKSKSIRCDIQHSNICNGTSIQCNAKNSFPWNILFWMNTWIV